MIPMSSNVLQKHHELLNAFIEGTDFHALGNKDIENPAAVIQKARSLLKNNQQQINLWHDNWKPDNGRSFIRMVREDILVDQYYTKDSEKLEYLEGVEVINQIFHPYFTEMTYLQAIYHYLDHYLEDGQIAANNGWLILDIDFE